MHTLCAQGYKPSARPPPVGVPTTNELEKASFGLACAASINDSAFVARKTHPDNKNIEVLFETGYQGCIVLYNGTPKDIVKYVVERGNLFNGLAAPTSPQEVLDITKEIMEVCIFSYQMRCAFSPCPHMVKAPEFRIAGVLNGDASDCVSATPHGS